MKLLSRFGASLLRTSPFAEKKLSFKKFLVRGLHFCSSFDLLVSVRERNVYKLINWSSFGNHKS